MLGIKPQTDEKRQAVLELMAEHFTNAESQKFRCEMGSVIPSNKEVQAMECVTSNPAMIASLEQSKYSTPQGYIHGSWWDAMINLVNDVKNSSDEAGYQTALDNYSSKLENIFNY
jgi:maltose-binding protein MalE